MYNMLGNDNDGNTPLRGYIKEFTFYDQYLVNDQDLMNINSNFI